ncbi:MAG: response regulator [Rhodospirillales bacterium]|nr:response regulator [Rhodospirillales bacterium]
MERYDLSHLDVLIVDRNPHMLAILRTALHELGIIGLRDINDPDKAFQMFKDQQADLIFSDWVPGRDELKFLNQVRDAKKSPNPFVPIIIVTAYSEQANVIAARDLGMTEFLAAPVSVKAIYNRICSVIKDKRLFIKQPKFFGPDRRRHATNAVREEERRNEVAPEVQEPTSPVEKKKDDAES